MLKFDENDCRDHCPKRFQRQSWSLLTLFLLNSSLFKQILNNVLTNQQSQESINIEQIYVEIQILIQISMENSITNIEFRRSSYDKSIFHLYYLIESTQVIPKLQFQVELQSFVRKGTIVSLLTYPEKQSIAIQCPLSGTVTNIEFSSPLKIKDNMIYLMQIRSCEHYPRGRNPREQSIILHDLIEPNNSILHRADICQYCFEQIWFYYQKHQKEITFRQLKNCFQDFDVAQFEWKLILHEQFTDQTDIGELYDETYRIKNSGKITFMYNFNGKQPPLDTVVLKYKIMVCKHEKISSWICMFCLVDMRSLKEKPNFRKYAFQYQIVTQQQNLLLSGNAVHEQAFQYKQNILKNRKGMLILDLDNTILHSMGIQKLGAEKINSLQQYFLLPLKEHPQFLEPTFVKMRPQLIYFLQKIVGLFEIFVYTKGTRCYAEQICQSIRIKCHQFLKGTQNFQPWRIISRDEDESNTKNLDLIIPENRQIILILDDRKDVWQNIPHCLYTKPFEFFYFVQETKDGEKLGVVKWEKGGTLSHDFTQSENKLMEEIEEAEKVGNKQLIEVKVDGLLKQIKSQMEGLSQIINLGNSDLNQNLIKGEVNLQMKKQNDQQNILQIKQGKGGSEINEANLNQIGGVKDQKQKQQYLNQNKQTKVDNLSDLNLDENSNGVKKDTNFTQTNFNPQLDKSSEKVPNLTDILENRKKMVKTYHSQREKRQKPENLRISQIHDLYLMTTLFALKQTHTRFFEKRKQPDSKYHKVGCYSQMADCFYQYKSKILCNLRLFFVQKKYKDSLYFKKAQKMGVKYVEKAQDFIDIVIRPNIIGKTKKKQQNPQEPLLSKQKIEIDKSGKEADQTLKILKNLHQVKKIPIVSQTWISTCYEYNCLLPIQHFQPKSPYSKSIFEDITEVNFAINESTAFASEKIKELYQKEEKQLQQQVFLGH